ncbi:hypothetical protein [Kitasatospora sp. NBC_00315]|uniref:hypothetical protein n=1 Tax=Kitasatospora sp. NBC_00315 TaxID=2975963 RepID=UPI003251CC9C
MSRSARTHLLLGVVAALTLTACGGSTTSGPRVAAPPSAASNGEGIAGKDRMIVAWCERFGAPSPTSADGKVHRITVAALSPTDGSPIARRTVTLPERGSVDALCGEPRSTTEAADRALFNADFTLIAGTAPGPGGALSAMAFALTDGAPRGGTAATAGGDSAPAFQSGTSVLWYETGEQQVTSRDLGDPAAAPKQHGAAPGPDFVLSGDQPWLTRPLESKPDQVAISPDGAVAAGASSTVWRRTDPPAPYALWYVEPMALGRSGNGRASLPGSEQVPRCEPSRWTSDVTLLCNGGDNLLLLTFSADRGRLDTMTTLLPVATSRVVESVAVSPDGRSLAYLVDEDGETGLYRLDLTPGARPVEIAPVDLPPAGVVNPLTPRLIAWL